MKAKMLHNRALLVQKLSRVLFNQISSSADGAIPLHHL